MAELMQGDIVKFKDQWGTMHEGCIVVNVSVELLPPHPLCEIYSPNFHESVIVRKDLVTVTNHPEQYEDRKNNVLYANQHYKEYLGKRITLKPDWQMFEDKLTKLLELESYLDEHNV